MTFSPNYLTYDINNSKIIFAPTVMLQVGKQQVSVTITDNIDSPVYSFYVTVTNQPPYFETELLPIILVDYKKISYFSLPLIKDPEDLPTFVRIVSGPAFVTV